MPLVYRAVLDDVDDNIIESVERLFAAWMHGKGLAPEDFEFTTGMSAPLAASDQPAWIQRRTALLDHGARELHRIRLVEEGFDSRWTTTALWTTQRSAQQRLDSRPAVSGRPSVPVVGLTTEGRWLWIDLEHEPFGGRPVRPGSPRLVRDLMAAGEAHDGRLPLTAEALLVTAGHVAELTGYIRDPARRLPIVVFADDPQRAYDQERLARQLARDLAGVAVVFRLADSAATNAFSASLSADYHVFAGALRTYLPNAMAPGDLPSRHRVLGRTSITTLGPRAFPAVKDQILHLSTQRPGPLDAVVVRRLLAEPTTRDDRSGASPSGRTDALLGWFGRQLSRIRGQRGEAGVRAPESLSVARRELAGEIDRLLRAANGETQGYTEVAAEELDGLRLDLAASEADREVLNQLLSEAESEARAAGESVRRLSEDGDYLQLELAEIARETDAARRRIRWLEAKLQELGKPAWAEPVEEVPVPGSVAEVLQLARQRLKNIAIGDTDADAAELDVHPGAELFAVKTWNALVALDDFAAAVKARRYLGSFYLWCQEQPAGASGIPAAAVSLVESESVDNHPVLRGKRVFPVPRTVARDGQVYMPAHIKIVKRGAPAPRLHFHDDTRGATRMVHVGYVGDHLPTAQFK